MGFDVARVSMGSRFRCHEDLAEIGACAHTNERQRGYLKMQGIVSREHTNVLVMTLGSRKLKTFSCLIVGIKRKRVVTAALGPSGRHHAFFVWHGVY